MYTVVITVVGILQLVAVLSIRNVAIREISRRRELMLPVALRSARLIGVATALCSGMLALYLSTEQGLNGWGVILSAILLLFANSLWTFTETLAFAVQEMRFSSILSITGSLVWFAAVVLVPASMLSVPLALAMFAVIQFLRASVYLLIEWRNGYFRRTAHGATVESAISAQALLKQSLPILGSALLAVPVMQLPLLFLGKFSGVEQVGYYGVGNKLTQPIALISSTLFHAIYPRLSGTFTGDPALFRRQAETFFFLLAGASFVFALSFGLFSREFVLLLFGSGYEPVTATFSAQIWMVSLWVLNNYFGSLLMASDNERSLLSVSIVNSIIIGAASFVGAQYGAFGLAVTSLVSCVITFFGYQWFLRRTVAGLLSEGRVLVMMGVLTAGAGATVSMSLSGLAERSALFAAAVISGVILQRRWLPDPMSVLRTRVKEV
ncbi:MAG: oligosaccharide flippase family protein [Bacteroidetes bacterium]|nr:oligosaccharide flippase family protein [Bacteroidota bacterium]